MGSELQAELAEYGLFLEKVKQGAKKLPKKERYFGVSDNHADDETKLFFPKNNIDELDNHSGMEIAQVVSDENESYNILDPTNFGKSLSMKEPRTIKNYLRKLLESV